MDASVVTSNSVTTVATKTKGGNIIVKASELDVPLLKEFDNLVVLCEDSSLLVLEQKEVTSRITVLETEDDADDLLSSDLLTKAISEETDYEPIDSSFIFNSADIQQLLDTENVLAGLVEALMELSKRCNSESSDIDSKRVLEVVLDLKPVFSPEYIFENIKQFSNSEIKRLMHSRSAVCTFKELTEKPPFDTKDNFD